MTASEIEGQFHKETFVSYCKETLTKPKRKIEGLHDVDKDGKPWQPTIEESGAYIETEMKKSLMGEDKFEAMKKRM